MSETPEERRRRHRDWRTRNRERLNVKRRSRYKEDPIFREQQKQRVLKAYYERKAKDGVLPSHGVRRRPQWAQFMGNKVIVITIGHFARRMGVSTMTIRHYEKHGVIPTMDGWRDSKGVRFWPLLFVDIVCDVFREKSPKSGRGHRLTDLGIREEVVAEWNKQKDVYKTNPNYGLDSVTRPVPPPPKRRKIGEKDGRTKESRQEANNEKA